MSSWKWVVLALVIAAALAVAAVLVGRFLKYRRQRADAAWQKHTGYARTSLDGPPMSGPPYSGVRPANTPPSRGEQAYRDRPSDF